MMSHLISIIEILVTQKILGFFNLCAWNLGQRQDVLCYNTTGKEFFGGVCVEWKFWVIMLILKNAKNDKLFYKIVIIIYTH